MTSPLCIKKDFFFFWGGGNTLFGAGEWVLWMPSIKYAPNILRNRTQSSIKNEKNQSLILLFKNENSFIQFNSKIKYD